MTKSTSPYVTLPPYPEDATMERTLHDSGKLCLAKVWEQPELCIVLGKGGRVHRELVQDAIEADAIPVYRREGGGGTVVLAPGMLIISVAAMVRDPYGNKRYFRLIQEPIKEALSELGGGLVTQRGISDLAVEGRKILGSSMRRKREFLLYQAVLLVRAERALFAKYLLHPPKEPDYREGRDHESFTVSLEELGVQETPGAVQQHLQAHMERRIPELFRDELLASPPS